MIRLMFSRRYWWTTLLVILACGVMARLGIWQLDRLEARRAFNARVQAQLDQPLLALTGSALQADLINMEYRKVQVVGEFLHEDEIALRNRVWGNYPGVSLVTPLRVAGTDQAILVERGWIPAEDADPVNWAKYAEMGQVEIYGVLRRSSPRSLLGGRPDPTPQVIGEPLKTWSFLDLERVADQVSVPLISVYIQQAADPDRVVPPYPSDPDLDLSEGSHQGYAGQWFLFACILGFGYPFYLRRQSQTGEDNRTQAQVEPLATTKSHL